MKTWNKRVVSQTSQLSLAILACTISLSASLAQASITLPPQKIFAIDTAHHGKGVLFSFKDGEQLEGCNSPNVFVPESPVLDRTLSIALSAYYANLNIQFNVQGCAEGAMQATALAIAKVYDTPGTHYTIASNLTQVNLASLIDPNSASIFYITIDHNTRLIGATGITGASGNKGVNGRNGYSKPARYVHGVKGSSGGSGGDGGNGEASIDLAGFSGKKVNIINYGVIQGGNGGQGGRGGQGGNGGIGNSVHGTAKNDSGTNCVHYGHGLGGAGGNGGAGGIGGASSEAIINFEGVDLTITGNATANGVSGLKGANGPKGKKGADGALLGCR